MHLYLCAESFAVKIIRAMRKPDDKAPNLGAMSDGKGENPC